MKKKLAREEEEARKRQLQSEIDAKEQVEKEQRAQEVNALLASKGLSLDRMPAFRGEIQRYIDGMHAFIS